MWANLPVGLLANRGAQREGRERPQSPMQDAVIHFLGGSELPPVSFDPWFSVVQFVLPGKGASDLRQRPNTGLARHVTTQKRSDHPRLDVAVGQCADKQPNLPNTRGCSSGMRCANPNLRQTVRDATAHDSSWISTSSS